MAEEPIIICDNLMKIYKVANLEVVALQGLDLVVPRGELLGVVGASGSGKSTLMNILGGLDRPSAGRVWVNKQDLLKFSNTALLDYRRTQIGFVWQQSARNLIPFLNAEENVELPLTLVGESPRTKRKRARELLKAVGLADRMHHHVGQLSGGEQQRVAIAVALVHNPIMLLADEPTGEVDSATALSIYQTFRDLNTTYGLTTLIVSHDPTIARHVDRVVAIRDGRLSSETMRQEPTAEDLYGPRASQDTEAPAPVFEELVVLDSAGRLQIPKEYLQRFQIKGRARLEITADGVLILPVEQKDGAPEPAPEPASLIPEPTPRGLRSRLERIRRKR